MGGVRGWALAWPRKIMLHKVLTVTTQAQGMQSQILTSHWLLGTKLPSHWLLWAKLPSHWLIWEAHEMQTRTLSSWWGENTELTHSVVIQILTLDILKYNKCISSWSYLSICHFLIYSLTGWLSKCHLCFIFTCMLQMAYCDTHSRVSRGHPKWSCSYQQTLSVQQSAVLQW